jgi:F0F1-type ATP synthase membrane subunit b/b'
MTQPGAPEPARGRGAMSGPSGIAGARGLEDLLYDLREMVETARMMPMSSSVLLNRDEALTLVEDTLESFPAELREARWLLKEREEYLARARQEADAIVESARVQAERMVERTEIAREARRTADQVIAEASAEARQLRHEAEDYIDTRLAAFDATLEHTLATVRKGRQRLQAPLSSPSAEVEEDPLGDVFDQDDA